MIFEFRKVMNMKITIFFDVTSFSVVEMYRSLTENSRHHAQSSLPTTK
jgi:hypothetical protein